MWKNLLFIDVHKVSSVLRCLDLAQLGLAQLRKFQLKLITSSLAVFLTYNCTSRLYKHRYSLPKVQLMGFMFKKGETKQQIP